VTWSEQCPKCGSWVPARHGEKRTDCYRCRDVKACMGCPWLSETWTALDNDDPESCGHLWAKVAYCTQGKFEIMSNDLAGLKAYGCPEL